MWGGSAHQDANTWQFLHLLCAGRQRPPDQNTAEKKHKLPSFHSILSPTITRPRYHMLRRNERALATSGLGSRTVDPSPWTSQQPNYCLSFSCRPAPAPPTDSRSVPATDVLDHDPRDRKRTNRAKSSCRAGMGAMIELL